MHFSINCQRHVHLLPLLAQLHILFSKENIVQEITLCSLNTELLCNEVKLANIKQNWYIKTALTLVS